MENMMTPQEWNEAIAPRVDNKTAQALIAGMARIHLKHNVLAGDMVSTTTLIECLYPLAYASQSTAGMAARDRIARALTKRALGAHELADCMTVSTVPVQGKFGVGYPCLWHAPNAHGVEHCPTCGQEIKLRT